jgi:hypothetical protein
MKKIALICLCASSISGCGLALQSQKDDAIARCHAEFPTLERGMAVQRVKCENAALDIMRSSLGHDDLFNLHHATALLIAERFQNGAITAAEAEQQIALLRSQIVSEADRRDEGEKASRSASSAALMNAGATMLAPRQKPVTTNCNRTGASINCSTY